MSQLPIQIPLRIYPETGKFLWQTSSLWQRAGNLRFLGKAHMALFTMRTSGQNRLQSRRSRVAPETSKPGCCTKSRCSSNADQIMLSSSEGTVYTQKVSFYAWSTWMVARSMMAWEEVMSSSGTRGELFTFIDHTEACKESGRMQRLLALRAVALFKRTSDASRVVHTYKSRVWKFWDQMRMPSYEGLSEDNRRPFLAIYPTTIVKQFLLDCIRSTERSSSLLYIYGRRNRTRRLLFCRGRQVLQDVVAGLCCLHSQGIAHLDLKTPNILLSSGGRAKIADLGLGKLMNQTETLATSLGTLIWMAPEHLLDGRCSLACDIFGLSTIIWEVSITMILQDAFHHLTPILGCRDQEFSQDLPTSQGRWYPVLTWVT